MTERDGTRVDCHVKILDDGVAERAKARGIDVLVYAPHFMPLPEIERRADRFSDDELLVVPAREVFTGSWRDRKHVLAMGLSEPIPDFISLDGAMTELARQDATVIVPHPEFLTVGLSADDVVAHRERIDAVEVCNLKHWPRHTTRAREIARAVDAPVTASSYAHLPGSVGLAWTTFDHEIGTQDELCAALQDGVSRQACRRQGWSSRLQSVAEFAHLGWENTGKKFDRIVLSGTEATHPDRPLYEGRFDDVSVY
ncbi:PHP-associated domain-containing protein [Natranaeroarchaeum aerophilus]|uniref:PHP domain-containing protein n=1 Tax=Natranaeroarchaeum aerophilus TaxID=2917711 RepID=A0AAE3K6V1_9EURY|nr:PHP domain-containing protein [Natranaeroarchaeum aerophilus]